MAQAIGANVVIRWLSDGGTESAYISFGEYNEDTNTDSHGIHDDCIFGYAADINDFITGFAHDVVLIEYDLVAEVSHV